MALHVHVVCPFINVGSPHDLVPNQLDIHTYVCRSLGVLLLNACLTVRERQPNSHAGKVSEVSPEQDAT